MKKEVNLKSAVSVNNTVSLTLRPNFRMLLLTIFLLPLLIWLGLWQLERADEKRQILASYQQLLAQSPLDITLLKNKTLPNYTPVILQGQFEYQYEWLLDNRVRNGRVGYEVITPFRSNNGHVILINRGWLSAPRLREDLPDIRRHQGAVTLFGNIYIPSVNTLIKNFGTEPNWPRRINAVDYTMMSQQSGLLLEPIYIRIHELSPAAFLTDWKVVNTQPEKHSAYAVQWFAMAFALFILVLTSNSNIVEYIKGEKSNT